MYGAWRRAARARRGDDASSRRSCCWSLAVIGGIYGGFFTPTEAAAVGTLFAMLIALAARPPHPAR